MTPKVEQKQRVVGTVVVVPFWGVNREQRRRQAALWRRRRTRARLLARARVREAATREQRSAARAKRERKGQAA